MAAQQRMDDQTDGQSNSGKTLKRRGILAAAGAVVAGIVAKQTQQPVEALTGAPLNIGGPNSPTNSNDVTFLDNPGSILGRTLFEVANFAGGFASLPTTSRAAIHGATNGAGATGPGDAAANLFGVVGQSDTGTGVFGESQTGAFSKGVHGKHDADGYAVYGEATALGGLGVVGIANDFYGVFGRSDSGIAVQGLISSTTIAALPNTAANTNAVVGANMATGANGVGVLGQCDVLGSSIGVKGTSVKGTGVYGQTTTGLYGVRGDAGTAPGSAGVLGFTNNVNGVAFGTIAAAPATIAGYFNGTTIVNGNFGVSGTKSAIVKDAAGNHRLMYCVEAPESWFEDVGTGTLAGGAATVTFDPDFAALIHTDSYHIFLTPLGDCKGLYVASKSPTGFTIRELQGGGSTIAFSWRVMAKRADIKGERLAKFTMPTLTMPEPVAPSTLLPTKAYVPPPPEQPGPAPAGARKTDAAPTTQAPAPAPSILPTAVPSAPSAPAPAPPRRP